MSWPATSRLPTRPHSISHKRRKCARSRTREIVPSAKAGSPVDNLRLPPLKTVGFDMSALHLRATYGRYRPKGVAGKHGGRKTAIVRVRQVEWLGTVKADDRDRSGKVL